MLFRSAGLGSEVEGRGVDLLSYAQRHPREVGRKAEPDDGGQTPTAGVFRNAQADPQPPIAGLMAQPADLPPSEGIFPQVSKGVKEPGYANASVTRCRADDRLLPYCT